jgi:hypothetical protein
MKLRRNSFKKTLPEAVQNLTSGHPTAEVEVWTMDEHRIGLKPIIRRVWRKRGQRPIVKVQHRYKWLYLYGFVCPSSGQTFWLLLPMVSIAAYTLALKSSLARSAQGQRSRSWWCSIRLDGISVSNW